MDFLQKVKLFNDIGGTAEEFNPRKAGLYTGLIFEELAEMVDSFNDVGWGAVSHYLNTIAERFKSGDYDGQFTLDSFDREEYLDAAVDIAVVSVGAGIAIGSDIIGAANEVADNNLSKFPIIDGEYTVLKNPETGKIMKPDTYQPVSLAKFLK
jgi:predicted HAD superfamily Cof-like phosphohydrolase